MALNLVVVFHSEGRFALADYGRESLRGRRKRRSISGWKMGARLTSKPEDKPGKRFADEELRNEAEPDAFAVSGQVYSCYC